MPSRRFKMYLLDYSVHSIIRSLFSRENNFNFIQLARIEESNITLVLSTNLSYRIIIIEIISSTISDYLVFASSLIYVKINKENMIMIFKEKLSLLNTSTPSALDFLVYLKILIRLLHARNFLCVRFDFYFSCLL